MCWPWVTGWKREAVEKSPSSLFSLRALASFPLPISFLAPSCIFRPPRPSAVALFSPLSSSNCSSASRESKLQTLAKHFATPRGTVKSSCMHCFGSCFSPRQWQLQRMATDDQWRFIMNKELQGWPFKSCSLCPGHRSSCMINCSVIHIIFPS